MPCHPSPPAPWPASRLGDNSKHVFFIGTDNHVYELYFTAGAGWVFNDLTALARAVPPTATSAIDGHRLSDDSKHVFFIGTDNHVHELFIASGGRWADNDLTTLAGAVPPTPTSALISYRLSDDSQHVFFIGTDNHVHELFIDGGSWADNDLTALAGAVPPTPTSALTGYPLSDDSQHVFFIGTDNHVHELFIDGAGWVDNDLTTLAGAVPPTPTSALTGYPLSNDSQHVFFIGTDSHVHELSIAGAGWADNDRPDHPGRRRATHPHQRPDRLPARQRQQARLLHRHRQPRPRTLLPAAAGWARQRPDGAHVAGRHCAQDTVDLATWDHRMTQHVEHPCRAHSRSVEGDGKRIQRRLRAP